MAQSECYIANTNSNGRARKSLWVDSARHNMLVTVSTPKWTVADRFV